MSDAAAGRWVNRAWALLAASSALYFLAGNEADNDLWMHLFAGRLIVARGAVPQVDEFSYTAAGSRWVDHEWLTQAAFATVYDALGSRGLWLCKLALALLTAWLVWRSVAARSRSPWVRGPLMVLVLAALARGYAIRPQIITYLGVAALLAALDRLDRGRPHPAAWRILALTAAGFALWANAHGGFVVGLGIVALFAAAPRWLGANGDDPPPPLRFRLLVLATATLAACLTPYGPSLFRYIVAELQAPHPLSEWQPVHLGDPAHIPFLLMLGAVIATLPFAQTLRRRPWRAALVGTVALMALRHQRHIPLFALCAAAPLAEQADGALVWLQATTRFRLSATATAAVVVALVGLACAQLAILSADLWRARGLVIYAAADYPVGALHFLREHGVHGNLALPLDWGGYALWHAAPAVRVSLDGRFATVYPPPVVEDNFAFFRGDTGAGADRLLDAYDTTLVLVPHGVPTSVDRRPDWQLLYSDSVTTLFGRTGTRAAHASEAPAGWLPFP